ncbi:regulatory protein, tetR family [Amycolatopsis xylanica]|uniref:Regulatory protein, tetR family n=2 Tax=Amycolatopsis xylanica TaxID=589385 RepID=A0A1H3Q910_9PSEU|nr:regulatory protein, tetR family [Amycolatopsis xylanica]
MMSDVNASPPESKRRGRRPAGQDTKTALLDAARAVFGESGYEGATVRAIATRAGVDAAMVNHWFGGKENLFAQAVLHLPFDPTQLIASFLDGDIDGLGERIVRNFLTVWDATDGGVFPALIRSIAGHDLAAQALRELFMNKVFAQLAAKIDVDQQDLRATLCASQMVGMGIVRYVAKFEPLASADHDTVIRAVAPNLQRYLTGSLD